MHAGPRTKKIRKKIRKKSIREKIDQEKIDQERERSIVRERKGPGLHNAQTLLFAAHDAHQPPPPLR
jgi:hypothetical protein